MSIEAQFAKLKPTRFDSKHVQAQAAAARNAGRLVRDISDANRSALRSIISRAIREKMTPWEAAKLVRSVVGLNELQAQGAANYYAQLKAQGLSAQRIDALMETYVARKVRERARNIAEYEMAEAANLGAEEAARQRIAAGRMSKRAYKEVVVTATACSKICARMSGKRVKVGQPFTLPDGRKKQTPPFHNHCRCSSPVREP